MRNTLTLLVLASLLSVVFSDLVIVASWKANEAFIARFLCVERDIQDSDCGGTCYLTAQLESNNSTSSDTVPLATLLEQSRTVLALIPDQFPLLSTQPEWNSDPLMYNDTLPPCSVVDDIFHPPRS
ncbi:MAG: hypothetical protein LAT57_09440 [Balneolales bacterium]|nr:hypothetical protein [Balneolales bacterium]